MEQEKIMEKLKKATGMEEKEILDMATKKKAELNDMVSLEGAVMLIAKEKNINLEETDVDIQPIDKASTGDKELTLDDLSKKYIKNPDVGEDMEFTTAKIFKSTDTDATTKEGKKFSTALSGVDYKMVYLTAKEEEYAPSAWEVVGKLNAICRKLKKIPGIDIKIKHIKDGRIEKDGDSYEVYAKVEGIYKQLDRKTSEWK